MNTVIIRMVRIQDVVEVLLGGERHEQVQGTHMLVLGDQIQFRLRSIGYVVRVQHIQCMRSRHLNKKIVA